MADRKVLNKYYPPDFDHARLPKKTITQASQIKVRMMMPMSVSCNVCGEYIYKGRKFNARKEAVAGEKYLGAIRVFRIYVRCPRCASEFTIKTDPENADYVCEHGVSRHYEPWRASEEAKADADKKKAEAEKGDAMKTVENRTKESKREMDILDALEELKSISARANRISHSQLEALVSEKDPPSSKGEKEEEEINEEESLEMAAFLNAKRARAKKKAKAKMLLKKKS